MDEPGSGAVEGLVADESKLVTCRITLVEVRATLAAARRSGRLTHDDAADRLHALARDVDLIEVDAGLCDRAGSHAERHGLRALDALHLAAAVLTRDRSGEPVGFASWDDRLRRAARSEKLAVVPGRI